MRILVYSPLSLNILINRHHFSRDNIPSIIIKDKFPRAIALGWGILAAVRQRVNW